MPFLIIIIVTLIILNEIYVRNYKSIRNFIYRLEIKRDENEFCRDINVIYSPSVVSYLYNQRIEIEKDLVADILNLYARKIINIVYDENEKINLLLNEKIYKQKYFANELLENDRYVIDTIVSKRFNFKYEEWKEKIIRVYREKINVKREAVKTKVCDKSSEILNNYHKHQNYSTIKLIGLILGLPIIYAIFMILIMKYWKKFYYLMVNIFVLLVSIILLYIICYTTVKTIKNRNENKDMHLTKNAKNELKKWLKVEKFIKENTSLKEKKFEEIILYEQYIPISMVLDINKKYKEEMKRILDKKEIQAITESIKEYKRNSNYLND